MRNKTNVCSLCPTHHEGADLGFMGPKVLLLEGGDSFKKNNAN